MRSGLIGARRARLEDGPLLSGAAEFVADLRLPGTVEAAFVRSPHAHAYVRSVELAAARERAGVVAAFAAADLDGVSAFPQLHPYLADVRMLPLAADRVRYVGRAVAVVVAGDRYLAEDAAERVAVDYDELPAVTSAAAALAADGPRLYEHWDGNVIVRSPASRPEVDRLLGRLPVFRAAFSSQRQAPSPIETRGVVAEYRRGRLHVWSSAQSPHILRTTLALVLGLAESRIHVVVPDVGGGFGCKVHQYPEEVVVPWLAMRLGRPVRWVEDRAEHLVATVQAREQTIEVEAAYESDGTIPAIRAHVVTDVGSGEIFIPGVATAFVSAACLTGPYRIPEAAVSVTCAVTNKTPSGAYRGFGEPECVFAMERTIESVARLVGSDPYELRRRLLIRPEEHPYRLPSGGILDSGSHLETFERCLDLGRAALTRARASTRADSAIAFGLGVAPYVEPTTPSYHATTGFWTGYDSATVRLEPDGTAVVAVGITAIGQGTHTLVATVAADALGIPIEQVAVITGDTDTAPYGLGAWGARGTVLATGAVRAAAAAVLERARAVAAHLLEADPGDVEFDAGRFRLSGSPEHGVSLADIARAAVVRTVDLLPGSDLGLEARATYDPPGLEHVPGPDGTFNAAATWSNACHAAIVRVDLETGQVAVHDYVVVHDCGTVVNPVIVEGQIVGGVAQGIAGALYERIAHDAETGQPLAVTYLDYLVPTACEIPSVAIEHVETPAPSMPLGAKGMGESGAIGGCAAIANAVCDALPAGSLEIVATPVDASTILAALATARGPGRNDPA